MAESPPRPYGDVEYGWPERGKYPLNDEERIRSAWDYIHQADNRAEAGDQFHAICTRIEAAWKRKIDPKGPPSAQEHSLDDWVDLCDSTGAFVAFDSDDKLVAELANGVVERTGSTEGVPWIERFAELFEGGKQKGVNYTDAMLDAMVSRFNRSQKPKGDRDWRVVVQLAHPEKGKPRDPRPTIGNLREVFRHGHKLYGWVRVIGQEAVDKVRSAVWNRISIGMGGPDGLTINHVAITPDPHVVSAAIFDRGGRPMADDDTEEMSKKHEKEMAAKDKELADMKTECSNMKGEYAKLQAKFEKMEKEMSKGKEDKKPEAEMSADPAIAAMQLEMASLAAELTAEREKRVEFERQQEVERLKTKRVTRAAEAVTAYGRAGKLPPVRFESESALVATFDDTQFEAYRTSMDKAPVLPNFTPIGKPDMRPPGVTFDAQESAAEVEQVLKMATRFGPVKSL